MAVRSRPAWFLIKENDFWAGTRHPGIQGKSLHNGHHHRCGRGMHLSRHQSHDGCSRQRKTAIENDDRAVADAAFKPLERILGNVPFQGSYACPTLCKRSNDGQPPAMLPRLSPLGSGARRGALRTSSAHVVHPIAPCRRGTKRERT
jgi:hypothetical protein